MKKPSYESRRVIALAAIAISLLCAANYYIGPHLFGKYDKQVMVLGFVILGLSQVIFGISPDEIQKYRDNKLKREIGRKKGGRSK
jgi:hypothetical protein